MRAAHNEALAVAEAAAAHRFVQGLGHAALVVIHRPAQPVMGLLQLLVTQRCPLS